MDFLKETISSLTNSAMVADALTVCLFFFSSLLRTLWKRGAFLISGFPSLLSDSIFFVSVPGESSIVIIAAFFLRHFCFLNLFHCFVTCLSLSFKVCISLECIFLVFLLSLSNLQDCLLSSTLWSNRLSGGVCACSTAPSLDICCLDLFFASHPVFFSFAFLPFLPCFLSVLLFCLKLASFTFVFHSLWSLFFSLDHCLISFFSFSGTLYFFSFVPQLTISV